MIDTPQTDTTAALVPELARLPHETECVELKENNGNPEMIG